MTDTTSFRKKFIVGTILCFLVCFLLPVGLVNSISTTSTTSTNDLATSTPATSTPPILAPEENGIEKPNGFFPLGGGNGNAVSDDFEAYTLGDLNGQGNWTGDTCIDVQDAAVKTGLRAIKSVVCTLDIIENSFSGETDGSQNYYVRRTQTAGLNGEVWLLGGGWRILYVQLNDGKINFVADVLTEIGTFEANQWYKITMEWRSSDSKVRAKVDENTWTNWLEPEEPWETINELWIRGNNTGSAYWDDFNVPPPPEIMVLVENVETEASFFIRKTLSYGRIIIILLLAMLLIFEITKFLTEIIIPQKLNFRK